MIRHFAIVAGIIGVFFFMSRASLVYGPYTYDEADYMYAVSLGFAANYTDSPTLPLGEFLRLGLNRGRDAGQRTELSEMIRASGDMVFYRHWHGPLYTDWLSLMKPFTSDEHSMRARNYLLPIATSLLMYFGALWLLPGASGQIAAILGAVLFLWSFPVINSSELAPHELFDFFVVAALLLLSALLARPSGQARRYWYAAIVATALAFCTLEVAFALIATLFICGHAVRDRLKPDPAFVAKSSGLFLASILLIWPAGIFKLSFLKAYLFMAYLAIFRKGAWGNNITVAGTWGLRFITSPVPWILLAVAILLLVLRRIPWSSVLLPWAIYAVSMFLAILKVNTDIPRYILPLFPAIVVFAAFALGFWLTRFRPLFRYGAVAVLCAAMFFTSFRVLAERHPLHDPNAYAMLDLIRQNNLSRKTLMVPHSDVPMVHYYFPEAHLKSYSGPAEIRSQLRAGQVDAVIYGGDHPRYESSHD